MDLKNAATQILIYRVNNGSFPAASYVNNCPSAQVINTVSCLIAGSNNTFTKYVSSGDIFGLEIDGARPREVLVFSMDELGGDMSSDEDLI